MSEEGTTTTKKRGPIAWMASNPIAANLVMLLLLLGGAWTTQHIQKEVEPQFQLDVVEIEVVYPGAAPSEVETGILLPIEEAVRGVQGIREITSQAREGSGRVTIELVSGADRMVVFQDIDQAVGRIQTFPDDIQRPVVRLQSQQREVMSVGVYGEVDPWTLRKLAEQLRDELLNHPAISQVEMGRAARYVTHVEISQHRLREYGLTLNQVSRVIADSSQDVPAGDVQTFQGSILLRVNERKQWEDEFATIPITTSPAGTTVTLGDVAEVTDGFEETAFHSLFNLQPSVGLGIFRIGEQSPLEIADAVHEVLEEFRGVVPPGVKLRVDSSAADDYNDRLDLLLENAWMAVIIVLVILSIFLELRLAFWVMMGMVVSFIGGLTVLPSVGVSVNMISMFGFLIVLGIVVDDAIVVGENVYEHRMKGGGRLDSTIEATREVSSPVVFSILTNVVAFVPLLFIPGETGKYWWPLPAVVIVVLLCSLFEALFILPAHLGHTSKLEHSRGERWLNARQRRFAKAFDRVIQRLFGPLLELSLRYRYVTLATATAILVVVGSYGYSGHMGMVMMPEVAADEIEAGVRMPVGTTPKAAGRIALEITEATLRMFEEHDLDRVAEGVKTNVRRGGAFIDVEIVMKPPDERDMTANEVIALWRDEIGDIDGVDQISFEAERGPGGWRQDIEVDLSHNDIAVLERAAEAFKERFESFESTRDVGDNLGRGKPQLNLKLLDEGRALGFTPDEVGRQVRAAFFGSLALRQLRGTNEIEVRVKLPESEREDLRVLEDFVLRAPDGTAVALREVVTFERASAYSSINRRGGRRVVTVSADVEPKSAMGRVMDVLQSEVLPEMKRDFPGMTWSFEGTQAEMRASTRMLWGGFALAMAIIYSLLAVAFRSYIQPLIVLCVIPFGIIGAVLGHLWLGHDLSLMSLMGIVALSGVVVNDSLIMVDFANRQRARDETAFEAIYQAGLRRFRPIMLTTLTTAGGLLPIILETSNQAKHLIPMAISLGFGIVFATAIVLVLVPSFYLVFDDLTRAFQRRA